MIIPNDIIQRLKNLDCEDVAIKLGIIVSRHKARCFMHDDKIPSLSFYAENRSRWHCFACSKGGDAIGLAMNVYSLDFAQACLCLCSIYGIPVPEGTPKFNRRNLYIRHIRQTPLEEAKKEIDAEIGNWILDNMNLSEQAQYFLFDKRLLDQEVVKKLKIVSISKSFTFARQIIDRFGEERCKNSGLLNERLNPCFWTPCLIFPFFDINGNLIGLQTRYLGNLQAPRFQFLSNQKSHIFNLPILNTLPRNATVYVTEGVTDCLAMLSDGKNAVAIPSATIIPESDLLWLKPFNLRMSPDNDANEAGIKGFRKLRDALMKTGQVILCDSLPEGFKDYSDYYAYNKRKSKQD
jgi:DNA primase